jgi:hypothetical protein
MEADYSGGQSSPWAVGPRGRNEMNYAAFSYFTRYQYLDYIALNGRITDR